MSADAHVVRCCAFGTFLHFYIEDADVADVVFHSRAASCPPRTSLSPSRSTINVDTYAEELPAKARELLKVAPVVSVPSLHYTNEAGRDVNSIPIEGHRASSGSGDALDSPSRLNLCCRLFDDAPVADSLSHASPARATPRRRCQGDPMQPSALTQGAGVAATLHIAQQRVTTLTISGIPTACTRADILRMLGELGYQGMHDFVWLPRHGRINAGYAVINFTHPSYAETFGARFAGYKFPGRKDMKFCTVRPAPAQGRKANVALLAK